MNTRTFLLALSAIALVGCTGQTGDSSSSSLTSTDGTTEATTAPQTQDPIVITTQGSIDPKEYTPEQEATITFSRMPRTVDEFRTMQQQLGTTPQGAVALEVVAHEMYRVSPSVGEECLALNNTEVNLASVLRRLKDLFNSQDAYYYCPQLAASFIEGATPQNAYNPPAPYTIQVRTHPVQGYQRSEMLRGYVLALQVYSSGYDTHWCGCEVVLQKGADYYVVSNCPGMLVHCKEIDFETDEEFHGLK